VGGGAPFEVGDAAAGCSSAGDESAILTCLNWGNEEVGGDGREKHASSVHGIVRRSVLPGVPRVWCCASMMPLVQHQACLQDDHCIDNKAASRALAGRTLDKRDQYITKRDRPIAALCSAQFASHVSRPNHLNRLAAASLQPTEHSKSGFGPASSASVDQNKVLRLVCLDMTATFPRWFDMTVLCGEMSGPAMTRWPHSTWMASAELPKT